MIRPLTCLTMLLAAGAGLYLYQEKHRAQLLDHEILRVVKATETTREKTGMLRAEWALLNEPDRLAGLADRHLSLRPLAPTQFTQLADLAARLPAIGAPTAPAPAVDDAPAPVADAAPVAAAPAKPIPAAKPPVAVAAKPSEPAATPKPQAVAVVAKPEPAVQLAAAVPKPVRPVAEKPVARPKPETAEAAAVAPAPAQRPIYAPVLSAYATPGNLAVHAPAVQRVEAVAAQPMSQMGGSLLGMARTSLPPPVPVGSPGALGGR